MSSTKITEEEKESIKLSLINLNASMLSAVEELSDIEAALKEEEGANRTNIIAASNKAASELITASNVISGVADTL